MTTLDNDREGADRNKTEAAAEFLELYLDDLGKRLVDEAQRNSALRGSRRISVADLEAAVAVFDEAGRSTRPTLHIALRQILIHLFRGRSIRRRLASALLLTLIVTPIGFGAAAVASLKPEPTDLTFQALLAIGLVGTISGMASWGLTYSVAEVTTTNYRKVRRSRMVASREFVLTMRHLEDAAIAQAARLAGGAPPGLHNALLILGQSKVWSPSDLRDFSELMQLRNSVVHEKLLAPQRAQLSTAMADANRLRHMLDEANIRQNNASVSLLSSARPATPRTRAKVAAPAEVQPKRLWKVWLVSVPAVASLIVLGVTTLSIGGVLVASREPPDPTRTPVPGPPESNVGGGGGTFTTIIIVLGILFVLLGIGAIVFLIIRRRRELGEDDGTPDKD